MKTVLEINFLLFAILTRQGFAFVILRHSNKFKPLTRHITLTELKVIDKVWFIKSLQDGSNYFALTFYQDINTQTNNFFHLTDRWM